MSQLDSRIAAKQILAQMPNPPFKFKTYSAVDNILLACLNKNELSAPKFPIVETDPTCKDIIKVLNRYYGTKLYCANDGQLFTIDCYDDHLVINVPSIRNASWGATIGSVAFINCKMENIAEILLQTYNYCMNNPIIYCTDFLRCHNVTTLETEYVQSLIVQAKHAANELKLLCAAASI